MTDFTEAQNERRIELVLQKHTVGLSDVESAELAQLTDAIRAARDADLERDLAWLRRLLRRSTLAPEA